MSARRPFVGGNAKMNRTRAALERLVADGALALADAGVSTGPAGVEVVLFPPFPYLLPVGEALRAAGSFAALGAQDVAPFPDGAYTGGVSTTMLKDCGVTAVLAGHSERRAAFGESDAAVNAKVRRILDEGLVCVLCLGETLEQRRAGETDRVTAAQLRRGLEGVGPGLMPRLVVAYEPVWAIGTGNTATPADAQAAHLALRAQLDALYGPGVAAATRIIYGGSVKASNAREIFAQPDVDGGLVGGGTLDAREFAAIVKAAQRA